MKLSWKLLPVAVLAALGVFLVSLPSGTKPANAGANGISVVPIIANSQYQLTTSFTNNPIGQGAVLSATAGLGVFTSAVPTGSTATAVGFVPGTSTSVTFTADSSGSNSVQTNITALFTCTQSGTVTFSLSQAAGSPTPLTNSVPVTCIAGGGAGVPGTGQLYIQTSSTVLPIGAQGSFTASATTTVAPEYISISSAPAIITYQQANSNIANLGNTFDTITGQNSASLFITAVGQGTRSITGTFTCTAAGTTTLTINLGQAPGVGVGAQSGYSQQLICGTGLVSPTVGPASAVTVAASPTSVGCAGTAFVTVTVRNALGAYVADGTSVTLTSTVGTLSPTTATTLGGGVLAVFTAPSNQSGTANISASAAGTAQGTATIAVNCNAVTPTPAIPPTIYIPPQVVTGGGSNVISGGSTGIISPPNTGNAGLARDNTWQLYAGIALIVMSAAGAAVAVRTRS